MTSPLTFPQGPIQGMETKRLSPYYGSHAQSALAAWRCPDCDHQWHEALKDMLSYPLANRPMTAHRVCPVCQTAFEAWFQMDVSLRTLSPACAVNPSGTGLESLRAALGQQPALVTLSIDFGRMGELDSVLLVRSVDDLPAASEEDVQLGEALGKHSDIHFPASAVQWHVQTQGPHLDPLLRCVGAGYLSGYDLLEAGE